jgi:hypothetical protein
MGGWISLILNGDKHLKVKVIDLIVLFFILWKCFRKKKNKIILLFIPYREENFLKESDSSRNQSKEEEFILENVRFMMRIHKTKKFRIKILNPIISKI